MKLAKIIENIDCKVIGSTNKKVEHLTHMAQEAKPRSIYFCLSGKFANGMQWVQTALENGCDVVVCEQSCTTKRGVTQIIVPDARKAMSEIASVFYCSPAEKLKIIGVTGTNGKTTTTTMIAHILSSQYKVGIIGTNGVKFDGKTLPSNLTTPDPIDFHKILSEMVQSGVEFVVMEISAHAIFLQKMWGVMCDIIAFTNLSQDHLDFFENMESYQQAKMQIFKQDTYKKSVVCTDTECGQKIAQIARNCTTCSTKTNNANIFACDVEHTTSSQTFSVVSKSGQAKITLKLLGMFNVQNALVAISVCSNLGLSFDQCAAALENLNGVDGRFECYSNDQTTVIVDFAHTPDGLKNILLAARQVCKKHKVICVFGCGGNRDKEKRPLMGAIAEEFSDFCIITTDNPRYEDNWDIACDIAKGFSKNKYKIVLDRGQALREAVMLAKKGDIVIFAGKGAETTTEICGTKVESSDKNIVKKVLCI